MSHELGPTRRSLCAASRGIALIRVTGAELRRSWDEQLNETGSPPVNATEPFRLPYSPTCVGAWALLERRKYPIYPR